MLSHWLPTLAATAADNIVQSDRTEGIASYQRTLGSDIPWGWLGLILVCFVGLVLVLKAINAAEKKKHHHKKKTKDSAEKRSSRSRRR